MHMDGSLAWLIIMAIQVAIASAGLVFLLTHHNPVRGPRVLGLFVIWTLLSWVHWWGLAFGMVTNSCAWWTSGTLCCAIGLVSSKHLIWPPDPHSSKEALRKVKNQQQTNQMLQEGIAVVQENLEIQEAIRASKRRSLRTQMNPHFLFNVLTGIQHLLILDERERALEVYCQFQRLLIEDLKSKNRVVGPLSDEIRHVREYLNLESHRLTVPIQWEIKLGENVNPTSTPCPLFILQPLVENAIWHGLRGGQTPNAELHIQVHWKANDLILLVSDNGMGWTPESVIKSECTPSAMGKQAMRRDPKFDARGLAILTERLQLFRHPGELKLKETPDGHPYPTGLTAQITLPLWRLENLSTWERKERAEGRWLDDLRPEVQEQHHRLKQEAFQAAREMEKWLRNR